MGLDFSRCRTTPFAHQKIGIEALCSNPFFFLTDEMGAGKSKQVIDAAQFLYEQGVIDRVLIVAPASVRSVWYDQELGELQKHLWTPSIVGEFHAKTRQWTYGDNRPLMTWFVTNYEFIRSKNRLNQLLPFCTYKTLLVLDESAYVKSHDSAQTKACKQLRERCGRVVLLNGTPIAHSPLDLFSQGNILSPTILNCKYITYFKAYYAVEEPVRGAGGHVIERHGRAVKTITGWRHLDEIQRRFAPYTLRRLKKDCLDLPPVLPPITYTVPLDENTWTMYTSMRDDLVVWLSDETVVTAQQAAVKVLRLAQLTSGFLGGVEAAFPEDNHHITSSIIPDGHGGTQPADTHAEYAQGKTQELYNTKEVSREKLDFVLNLYRELLAADPNLKVIVWCRFVPELKRLIREMQYSQYDCGFIYGGQNKAEREAALRLLDPRTAPKGPVFFVGTYGTGSLGINLTAAHTVINMSYDYSYWKFLQSAARVDRPGQVSPVSIIDIVATGPTGQATIDKHIVKLRRQRADVAEYTTAAWVLALREE